MKQTTDTDETLHNITKNHKIKILTVNVNGFNNSNERTKIFNFLKTNKIDITLFTTRNTLYEHTRKTMAKRVTLECPFGIRDPHIKLMDKQFFLEKTLKEKSKTQKMML